MNNLTEKEKELTKNTRDVLDFVEDMDINGTDTLMVLESAFINQIAGMMIANKPGGDEDQRHQQLVYLLSDYVKCMKAKFMGDSQVIQILGGKVLGDITLFSEKLIGIQLDQMIIGGYSPSSSDC
jgi:hypothetical protein